MNKIINMIFDFFVAHYFTFALIATLLVVSWCSDSMRSYDDTDDYKNKRHSGLGLYTDNLTGCQYIKGGRFGGITPRIDGDGNHLGCKDSYNGKKLNY